MEKVLAYQAYSLGMPPIYIVTPQFYCMVELFFFFLMLFKLYNEQLRLINKMRYSREVLETHSMRARLTGN